jgi:hypothetical protein
MAITDKDIWCKDNTKYSKYGEVDINKLKEDYNVFPVHFVGKVDEDKNNNVLNLFIKKVPPTAEAVIEYYDYIRISSSKWGSYLSYSAHGIALIPKPKKKEPLEEKIELRDFASKSLRTSDDDNFKKEIDAFESRIGKNFKKQN